MAKPAPRSAKKSTVKSATRSAVKSTAKSAAKSAVEGSERAPVKARSASATRKAERSDFTTREDAGVSKTKAPGLEGESLVCRHCSAKLEARDQALFVEEEVGRIFCSEECIAEFFSPEVNRLEKEYLRRLSSSDLSGDEKEKYSELRWVTLEEPDEIWREKTLNGDFRYTLISQFRPEAKTIWCVCICLFLRGQPSFLYLAFPTRNEALVAAYRRGERLTEAELGKQLAESGLAEAEPKKAAESGAQEERVLLTPSGPRRLDGLADHWTEEETLRAERIEQQGRGVVEGDIPAEDYDQYQGCLEQTLEVPDEVWTIQLDPEDLKNSDDPMDRLRIYHFVRRYQTATEGYWYVIVARETEDENEIELLEAFPTKNSALVDRYRRGTQEVGQGTATLTSRLVH